MTPDHDLVLRGRRVHRAEGFEAAEVGVSAGRIAEVVPLGTGLRGEREIVLSEDEVLLPGLVDSHVHINDPGRSEWEGFDTATRAAARGGVTTVIDMPLNSIPPTTSVSGLSAKVAATEGRRHVDIGFWGGAVPGNLADLRYLHSAGVFGFKCFTLPSGVDEFPHLRADELRAAMAEIASFDGLMIVHAEDPGSVTEAPPGRGYGGFLASRPPQAETRAIAQVIDAARETGARVHLLHLSAADSLPLIAAARTEGVRLTAETCPHYLTLSADAVPEGATAYKCCPPIRDLSNQDRLWQGLLDGTIDCVVTDHSPSTAELKHVESGDFGAAWGGIASLQLGLPIVWTEARQRGVPLETVVNWMSAGPADIAGLHGKGRIRADGSADLMVFAPEASHTVEPARLEHRHPVTPYVDRTLHGVVRRTLLAGEEVDFMRPSGRLLWRGES
ncbi:allantoinase AllB [Brevibacterium sp.]|uniref:allantoinase AllB n=1 Tax=Brevibacterium sp. TaxID=1701 RepID=UPI0025B7AC7A|nr:allantoinase AllB [Brevibacterium sp.]